MTDSTPSITKVLSQLQNLTEPSNFTITQKEDRPWSKQDFAARVKSFKTYNWFAKPKQVSPLIVARFGFVNVDVDTIECVSCKSRMTFTISDPSHTKPDQINELVNQFFTELHAIHNPLCPWLNNSTPESFASYPNNASSIEIQEDFLTRLKKLYTKTDVLITSSSQVDDFVSDENFLQFLREKFPETSDLTSISVPIKIALLGWSYSETDGTLHCEQCQRTVLIKKESSFNIITEHKSYCPWPLSLSYLKTRLTNAKTIRIPTTEEMAATGATKRTEDPLILVKRVFDGNKRLKS